MDESSSGGSDTVMVLVERDAGQLRHQVGGDDSGEDRNATLQLISQGSGEAAVMLW